ncbi:MAG: ATP-dependent sacrificial sulfur transferase LarE [Bacteroidales bacterium]
MSQSARTEAADAPATLADKEATLREALAGCGSVIVAYSGGADSAYLAYVSHEVLGDKALCVTAESPSYPRRHRELALRVVRQLHLNHRFIETHEMDRPDYRANPANRCYFCKQELYEVLGRLAREGGYAAIVDGNNADDRGDYRPGRQAAREAGVRSPLDEADLSKEEIRYLSRAAGLPTWDQPASACLSSRIPYLSEVTNEKLQMIERAEMVLQDLGFRICRVRHHGDTARLEMDPNDMARAVEPGTRATILSELRALGFRYVTVDLQGYRSGSLNEGLRLRAV